MSEAIETSWDLIPYTDIEVGERARTDLGDTSKLEESSKKFGQLQNIVVERQLEGKPYRLLAGERRLQTLPKVGIDKLFAKIYPPLTAEQRLQIELDENTARLDMSWQDEARLVAKIHSAQLFVKGAASTNKPEGWSQRKTAELLGASLGAVNLNLQMSKLLEQIPELAKCKTRREAENIVAKEQEKLVLAELRKRAEQSKPAGTLDQIRASLVSRYIVGDSFALIKDVPDSSIDLIDLDPPYGIEYNTAGVASSSARADTTEYNRKEFREWEADVYESFLPIMLRDCLRVLKPNGWLICWYAQDPWAEVTFDMLVKAGFELKRIPLVWNKNVGESNSQASAYPDYYLGRTHETAYYARKGSPCINRRARADVFNYARPAGERTHPTEKPVMLMRDILSTFVPPKSRVLVPFAGSGNTLIAAMDMLMHAEGFDLSEEYKTSFIAKAMAWEPGA